MRKQSRRKRRIVRIVAFEQDFRCNRFGNLDESAVVTERELQWKARLCVGKLPLVEQGIRNRL